MTTTVESISRGVHGGQDTPPYWVAWRNYRTGELTYTLVCVCGIEKGIKPEGNGRVKYKHAAECCGWEAEIELEGFGRLYETERQRRNRVAKAALEEEAKYSMPLPRG